MKKITLYGLHLSSHLLMLMILCGSLSLSVLTGSTEPNILMYKHSEAGSRRLKSILSLDHHPHRAETLRHLSHQLNLAEQEDLLAFLSLPDIPEGMNEESLAGFKNNIIVRLMEQSLPPQSLTATLIDMYRNKEQPILIRDYAIQNMARWHGYAKDRSVLEETLWSAAEENYEGRVGTALIALRIIHERAGLDDIHTLELAERAVEVAADERYSLSSRISAMQVAGKFAAPGAEEVARMIAQDSSAKLHLRIASIAALGEILTSVEDPMLQAMATREENPYLAHAAQAALQRIQGRSPMSTLH